MDGKIKIIGSHDHGDGEPEIVKTERDAICVMENDTYIITYTDSENGDPNASDIQHTLRIGAGTVDMLQTGAIESELRFGPGKTWNTDYQTPYGLMNMTAITRHLMIEISPKKISAHLQYELQLDGNKLSDSKVRISFVFN